MKSFGARLTGSVAGLVAGSVTGLVAGFVASSSASLVAGLVMALLVNTAAVAQPEKSDDVSWLDAAAAPLEAARLVEYFGNESTGNRYWFDLASATAAGQSIVRFSSVIESAAGVRNLRHEAIRCASKERKLLAIGRNDGSWSPTSNPAWIMIGDGPASNQGHTILFRALCFGGATANPEKIRERLEGKIRAY